MFFFLILKGELALAYESYVGGTLIVILIEVLNDYYLLYPVLAGSNKPFRVTSFTSNISYTYSVSGKQTLTTVLVFLDFFLFCVHLFVCQSVSVHLFTIPSF